jgi:predicted heme/steroid binding protein
VRTFTRAELRKYTGRDGGPVYFAYKGKVYDASASWQWRGGRHQVMHQAGQDLTESLADAPHGEDLLARLPVVGLLVD